MNTKLKLIFYSILISVCSLSFAVDTDGDGLQDYQITTGANHNCAIDDNGVQCWGSNSEGQIEVPPALVNPVAVSAGPFHTCAIDDNGLHCWGRSYSSGQIDVPPDLVNTVAVSNGFSHTCALADANTKTMAAMLITIEHYPSAADKQVLQSIIDSATATSNEKIIATAIMNLEHQATAEDKDKLQTIINDVTSTVAETTLATIIHAFSHMTTAEDDEKLQLIDDKRVRCWGGDNSGQATVPNNLINPVEVSAGEDHTCTIHDNGVQCWGANNHGQTTVPNNLVNPIAVSAGDQHTCAIDDNGLHCWGWNNWGELDVPETLVDPTVVSAGGNYTCAIDDKGAQCWGRNLYGQIVVPDIVAKPTTISAGSLSESSTCVLDYKGAHCWGDNNHGQSTVPLDLVFDRDSDGVEDKDDDFPLDLTETTDADGDGIGNNADAFPFDATETIDTDGDGDGNNADIDDDDDGVDDVDDDFPLNNLYSIDTDSDGMPDVWETKYGLDPNDPSDAASDRDNDGVTALEEFLAGTIPSGSLDIDGNDQYDALTDGLLLLRGMFGLDGSALVTGTVASNAVYTESVDIESRIEILGDLADIDGNGEIDALTDGLLILRYLFGLEGDTLINGVVAGDATRMTAEKIEAHLETLMPAL